MDIRAFLSHIVQLDIRIRKAINTQMHGNFSSKYKLETSVEDKTRL